MQILLTGLNTFLIVLLRGTTFYINTVYISLVYYFRYPQDLYF